eukprot:TRINITY_DN3595_c0_g1_i1.p1 TRINITY_DN3595_c0_g1~~TRINITY_DN3595_c0_g1_i1.p1  ORF type:complete len:359 (-),score=60.04 TRINITY_DN3595_c0_g1_i1:235-1263(-)
MNATTLKDNRYELSNYSFTSFNNAHNAQVWDVMELVDGTLVSCSWDHTIKRWSADGHHHLNSFLGHTDRLRCLMEVDDNTFLSASFDKVMKVWNKTTGECIQTLFTDSGVSCLLKLHDNTRFWCGTMDGEIEERKLGADYELLVTFNSPPGLLVPYLRQLNSGYVLSGTWSNTLKMWDVDSKTVICTLTGLSDWTETIALRDHGLIASVSSSGVISIWNLTTGRCLKPINGHTDGICKLVELPDGTLLSASWAGTIQVWDCDDKTGQCLSEFKSNFEYQSMIGLRDGSILLCGKGGELQIRKTWISQPVLSLVKLFAKLLQSTLLNTISKPWNNTCPMSCMS